MIEAAMAVNTTPCAPIVRQGRQALYVVGRIFGAAAVGASCRAGAGGGGCTGGCGGLAGGGTAARSGHCVVATCAG